MEAFKKLIDAYLKVINDNDETVNIADVQLEQGYSKGWYIDKCNSEYLLKEMSPITDAICKLRTALLEYDDHKHKVDEAHKNYCEPKSCTNNRFCLVQTGEDGFYPFYWTKQRKDIMGISNSHSDIMHFLDRSIPNDSHYIGRWCGFYSYICGNNTQILTFYDESFDYRHNSLSWCTLNSYVQYLCKEKPFHFTHIIIVKDDSSSVFTPILNAEELALETELSDLF